MKKFIEALRAELDIPDFIAIKISFVCTHDCDTQERIDAYCVSLTDTLYEISIHEDYINDIDYLVECISHEMKHVKQGVSGDLKTYEDGYVWKGKHHTWDEYKYGSQPHEIEAKKFEKVGRRIAIEVGLLSIDKINDPDN